jgi:monoamine oxidase
MSADNNLPNSEPEHATSDRDFDAIVIGAGFAGITAARELRAQGRRTLLLEARDRIGGRTWTDTFLGELIERGGTWVDQSQPHIWREIVRYKIPLVADEGPESVILPTLDGFSSCDPDEAYERQAKLFAPLFDGSREYFERPYDPFFREDLVRKIDKLSLRDRLDQLHYPPKDEIRLTPTTSVLSGGSSKRGALAQFAQWWSLSGWTFDSWNGLNTYRPKLGTIALLKAMLADASPELRLNSPVVAIADGGRRAHVTTRAGERFSAPAVVVAVPVNVWKTIKFTPELPKAYVEASTAGIGAPNVTKLWLHLSGPLDRFIAEAPEGYPISQLITHSKLDDGQLTIGFSVDGSLDLSDRGQVEAAVRRIVPKARLVDFTAQAWWRDKFSLGGWTFKQPLQLTKLLREIQQPQGRITFATSDIASGWSGYMDGAIESGLRAAGCGIMTSSWDDAKTTAEPYALPAVSGSRYRSAWPF